MSGNRHVYVVSGASRGIGNEFTRQLLDRSPDSIVFALMRKTQSADNILSKYQDRYIPVHLDLLLQESINKAGESIKDTLKNRGHDLKIDMLVNAAGILGGEVGDKGPERSISGIDRTWLESTLQINLVGHVMVTQQMIPLMKRTTKEMPSKIINLSARVGSIGDNSLGGWYSYRMSKAALNMFTKTTAIELKRHNVICLSMHPGTTGRMYSIYS